MNCDSKFSSNGLNDIWKRGREERVGELVKVEEKRSKIGRGKL